MPSYEYKVIPAPAKAEKVRGVKTPEGRFAHTIEALMNRMAEGGWEFQRAELLPSEERSGLTGSTTTWRNVLVFRRARRDGVEAFEPELLERPPLDPDPEDMVQAPAPVVPGPGAIPDGPRLAASNEDTVEEVSDVASVTSALKMRAAQAGDPPLTRFQDEADDAPDGAERRE